MYRGAFKNLIRIIGDKLMKKVSPLDVEAFKINRAKEIAPVSVNVELRSLRAAFREAKRLRLIDESPFEGMKQLRVPHKEGKCLTETEFWKLIEIMDPEFRNLIKFALYTVTRLGEIVSLRWDDVDLAARKIHIRSKADFRVKGGKPRSVPLHPWVSAFLESRKRQGEYVFTKSNGWPLQGPTVSRKLKRYLRKAGLDEGLHFHSLRHTGISWLQNRGVSPQFVQRIAGHSSLNVTQIYTHVHDESLFSAINAFGQPKI
jgi:integrase/recombinase XerD